MPYPRNGEDTGGAVDWSIGDEYDFLMVLPYLGITTTQRFSIRIAIKGYAGGGTNNAPVFSPATATREVAENSAAGTNVGAVIPEATDANADTLTYSMGGADAASFAFDISTRQITTVATDFNYEATKNSYTVTVTATDGTDSGTITVTIDVTDVAEQPAKPDPPTVTATAASPAAWT